MELEVENADCSVPTVPPTIVDGTNCIVQEGEQMRVITDGQFLLIAPNMVCFCNVSHNKNNALCHSKCGYWSGRYQ